MIINVQSEMNEVAVSKRSCPCEGPKGMRTKSLLTRAPSLSVRAGIAYADVYAGLRTPGFCLHEVLSAALLLQMNKGVLGLKWIHYLEWDERSHATTPKTTQW